MSDPQPPTPPPNDPPQPSEGEPRPKRVTIEDVKQVVADAVNPIMEKIDSLVGGKKEDTPNPDGDNEPITRGNLVKVVEEKMKEAVSKISQNTPPPVSKEPEKSAPEAPPKKARWSTRMMGWD